MNISGVDYAFSRCTEVELFKFLRCSLGMRDQEGKVSVVFPFSSVYVFKSHWHQVYGSVFLSLQKVH